MDNFSIFHPLVIYIQRFVGHCCKQYKTKICCRELNYLLSILAAMVIEVRIFCISTNSFGRNILQLLYSGYLHKKQIIMQLSKLFTLLIECFCSTFEVSRTEPSGQRAACFIEVVVALHCWQNFSNLCV